MTLTCYSHANWVPFNSHVATRSLSCPQTFLCYKITLFYLVLGDIPSNDPRLSSRIRRVFCPPLSDLNLKLLHSHYFLKGLQFTQSKLSHERYMQEATQHVLALEAEIDILQQNQADSSTLNPNVSPKKSSRWWWWSNAV